MKKFFKVVLVSLLCLVLLIGIAGYVVLRTVDLNQYKGIIETKVAEFTGRELKIGSIGIKASLSPTVELENVTFSNASWCKSEKMAAIGAIDVGVAVLPLLHNDYIITKFIVKDAVINLEENENGEANWVFETSSEKSAPEEEKSSYRFSLINEANAEEITDTAAVASENPLRNLKFNQVALQNVQINYTDKKGVTQSYDIENITLDENKDGNYDINFDVNSGLYKGKGVIGAFNLLDAKSGYPVKIDANIMGIQIATDMVLFDVLNNIGFDGRVNASGFLGRDSHYKEAADISVKGNLEKIDAIINSFKIAGNVITGDVKADISQKIPEVLINLKSDKIDIASFVKQENTSALPFSLIKEAHATKMVPAEVIPYEVLSLVKADANVSVEQIVDKGNLLISDVVLNAKVVNGFASLNIIKGTLARGNVNANITLNAADKTLSINADLVKINLITLIQALQAQSDNFSFMSGSDTDLSVKLKGKGNTCAAIAESLDGQVIAIVDKSQIHLGNIGMMKGNIISQLFNTLKLTKGNDNLDMACAVVRADFKNGLANFPNGIVVNADKFNIVANGDINLKNDKIDIGIKPFGGKLTDTNIAKALSSLVKLTGTLEEPSVGIDTANAVKNIVGATMTGPVYLGTQMVMESDSSPCYTALKGTSYEDRFPKSENIVRSTSGDVGKALDDSVDMVKGTAKGLFNMLSGKSQKSEDAE